MLSYLILLLLAELSGSNLETEITEWFKQEKLNVELFSYNGRATINCKENGNRHPRAGRECSEKECLWRGTPPQSWSSDLSGEEKSPPGQWICLLGCWGHSWSLGTGQAGHDPVGHSWAPAGGWACGSSQGAADWQHETQSAGHSNSVRNPMARVPMGTENLEGVDGIGWSRKKLGRVECGVREERKRFKKKLYFSLSPSPHIFKIYTSIVNATFINIFLPSSLL